MRDRGTPSPIALLSLIVQAATPVKICVPTPENQTFVDACTKAVSAANTDQVTFSCVLGGSLEACSTLMEAGSADLTRMGGA